MKKRVVVGSRESRLAVVQAQTLVDYINGSCPGYEAVLVTMKTTGDRLLDRRLDQAGGKGLFVKELEAALFERRADLCVHSLKEVAVDVPRELPLVGYAKREDVRDVLVMAQGRSVPDLSLPDLSLPVGSASLRRTLQLRSLYPHVRVEPVRGNVLTRLAKLDAGEYGALVLAAAGLLRLGLGGRISRYFTVDEMLPAGGQGILAVQGRAGEDYSYLDGYFDAEAEAEARAERAFLRELDAGCASPVAAYATVKDGVLTLRGFCDTYNGRYERESATGSTDDAEQIGIGLARYMRDGL